MSVCLRRCCALRNLFAFFIRVTQLMNTRCLSAILAVIFLAAGLPSAANAAFYNGTDTLISGQASFSNSSSQLYGYADYAVYSPGYFPWSDSFPDQFFYCYQIFNSSESSNIARFIVDLDSDVTAYSPNYFISSEDDIQPNYASIQQNDVVYMFNGRITANHNSYVLFFAGDAGPEIYPATIVGTLFGSTTVRIPIPATEPAPAPEPASLLIFALAASALLKTRRRKS
jgi:hypothetical protein